MMTAMDQLIHRDVISPQRLRFADVRSPPLAITFATSVALMSGATMLYPVLPVLAADLKVDATEIGLAMAAYTAPAIVLAPLFGIIADLRGRKWMLVLGLTLFGLAGAAAALAPNYGWLLAMRAIQGVGMSAITPLTIVLISDLLPDDQEIHGQGIKVALDRVAMIVLPLAGGALAALSWRAAFVPYLLILPLALAALVWMPETRSPGAETLREYLQKTFRALREPRLTIAFAVGFLRFFLDYGLFTYLPLIVALHYAGAATAGATTSGWLIAASAIGSIVDRDQRRPHLRAPFRRAAAGGGVLRQRARAWRHRVRRAAVADRAGVLRVRARQRPDLAAAEEPADAPHARPTCAAA